MSRKRISAVALLDVGPSTPTSEDNDYEYYRPGCYCIPQVPTQLCCYVTPTPYCCGQLQPWRPCCSTATYVVDASGRAYYMSDLELQYQLPPPTVLSAETEVTFHCYKHTDVGMIPSMPQIDEDDYYDPPESPRKRERFQEQSDDDEDVQGNEEVVTKRWETQKRSSNVYRANEGYLVEEPKEDGEVLKKL